MRISAKISLALGGLGLGLFGLTGISQLRTEERDLRRAVEKETKLLGRSVQVSVENALRDMQIADIHETLDKLRGIDAEVELRAYDSRGKLLSGPPATDEPDEVERALVNEATKVREGILRYQARSHAQPSSRLLAAYPLQSDDHQLLGSLVLTRPLDELERDLASTRNSIAVSVASFVVGAAALGLLLGAHYIGRPLRRMGAAMREVGSGDLSAGVAIQRNDEVGDVARVFNAMVEELRRTRQQRAEEAEERRVLLRALQEADKLVTVGQLSAGLAHEIGSPLQIINGRARALIHRTPDPQETRRVAEILVEQTDRITRIVEQLLNFARRSPRQLAPTDLGAAIRPVVDLLQLEAKKRQVVLTLETEQKCGLVDADPDKLQQVALNLLRNGMMATPAGGSVHAHVRPGTMTLTGDREPIQCVRLTVDDTGPGIEMAVQDRLFEPFFTTRADAGGTGLGLSIVKAIIDEHGGRVRAMRSPAGGARFEVLLPISPCWHMEQDA